MRDYVLNHAPDTSRIADIRAASPGVNDQTIHLALEQIKARCAAGHPGDPIIQHVMTGLAVGPTSDGATAATTYRAVRPGARVESENQAGRDTGG